jgi:formamidopyrimidine-DNA glycosylase
MPELPEVETTVRELRLPLIGRRICGVRTEWPRHIAQADLVQFAKAVQGCQVEAIDRRGKYLVLNLSDGKSLVIHLRMSGHLSVVGKTASRHKHDRTVFSLDDGRELRFRDQRKFGRIYLVEDVEELLSHLGPEPLAPSFTADLLAARLSVRSRALKPLLLDQGFIAGIGNIYANEALFLARLHPELKADQLSQDGVVALHDAIQRSLVQGLSNGGASIDLYLKPDGSKGEMQEHLNVHGRAGQPCFRCGTTIARITVGGRGTFYCPGCQDGSNR